MMHMTFYWSRYVTVLFSSWKTDSWTSYAVTLLACLIVSVFYQYMEDLRLRFKLTRKTSPIETPLIDGKISAVGLFSAARCGGSVLFGVNSAIGYMLMLAVMSFNGGVFVAVVVGLAVGYWLFRSIDDHSVVVVDSPCACA